MTHYASLSLGGVVCAHARAHACACSVYVYVRAHLHVCTRSRVFGGATMCSLTECVLLENVFSYRMCSLIECVLLENVFSYKMGSLIECVYALARVW